jgi:hypothetical protein
MNTSQLNGYLREEIETLRTNLPVLVDLLKLPVDIAAWESNVDKKVLPKLAPDFPLVAAICGGGSSGKSSLFNTLIQEQISPTGGTAGINRRILVSGNERYAEGHTEFAELFESFGFYPQPLRDISDLTQPGEARYILNASTPENLILIDTPDFDTGLKGTYLNREIARQALDVSDILIYIFTNANYNNRDNTDFIADILTGIGLRKCFLVYRVYASYADKEIIEHANTVAQNLYGHTWDQHVLGVYRAEEDNRVAADEIFVKVDPVGSESLPFMASLTALERDKIRLELMKSVLNDVLLRAHDIYQNADISLAELDLYRNALQAWQSRCVQKALKRFPMDAVLTRFMEIWHQTDPTHIRFMRKAGRVIDLPVRAAIKTVKWFRGQDVDTTQDSQRHSEQYLEKAKEDFFEAANDLWHKFVDADISVTISSGDPVAKQMSADLEKIRSYHEGHADVCPHQMQIGSNGNWIFGIKAHQAIIDADTKVDPAEWRASIEAKLSDTQILMGPSDSIDRELRALVERFRSRMNIFAKLGQTFSAFLNVLPATLAVTYILSTGDPVGAAGIKVKLSGLFGLKDLYALVALPATTGLRKADRAQLETLMGPIAQTWLNHKLKMIQTLFEGTISGQTLDSAEEIGTQAKKQLNEIEQILIASNSVNR